MATTSIDGPDGRSYTIEPGVLDQRAVFAYRNGQCHAMGIALNDETGWPLVAIESTEGVVEHVCVRRDDGRLVDVRGAHYEEELVGESRAVPIDRRAIDKLVQEGGWASPAVEEAAGLVPAVLVRGRSGPEDAMAPSALQVTKSSAQHELCFEWQGEDFMTVWVRATSPDASWAFYSYVPASTDCAGRRVIDFTLETLDHYALRFLNQFDERAADERIAAGRRAESGTAAGRPGPLR